jgi:hypothetical protein
LSSLPWRGGRGRLQGDLSKSGTGTDQEQQSTPSGYAAGTRQSARISGKGRSIRS